VVGQLLVTEILLLIAIPFLVLRQGGLARVPQSFVWLALLWLAGQVISDLWIGSRFEDAARGWASVAMTITDLVALALLLTDRRRILLFAGGIAAGVGLSGAFLPSGLAVYDPFKWAYAYALAIGAATVASTRWFARHGILAGLVVALSAPFSFAFGLRSMGGISTLAAALLGLRLTVRRRYAVRPKSELFHILAIGVVTLAIGAVTLGVYGWAAESGVLGVETRAKYERQSKGDLGLLIGGRSESLVSLQAILDSPLIGHGSWAQDPYYVNLLSDRLRSLGYSAGQIEASDLIPGHSYLLGEWMHAGVLAAFFWIAILLVVLRAMAHTVFGATSIAPLAAFCASGLLWDILFSPYGGSTRVIAMFSLCVLLHVLRETLRPMLPTPPAQNARWANLDRTPGQQATSAVTDPSSPGAVP
jgi:hypothetical protein